MFPYSVLYANNNGPNAPEAASFEPVDATDMVNLVTGDFTYVLPLLNVPSPEGGYPLALSYHAGIAMDQEASWTGLGWNLNPGAINRSVNGVPDDYKSSLLTEYYWDSEQKVTEYHASAGFSMGKKSIGLAFSWGSHKSFGGTVSIGIGSLNFNVGENFSMNINANNKVGLSYGVGLGRGGVTGNLGFKSNNGMGLNVSSNGSYSVSMSSALDGSGKGTSLLNASMNFSSNGVGLSVIKTSIAQGGTSNQHETSTGVGMSFSSFSSTITQGDYSVATSSWSIPLMIPIKFGFLSFSVGKTETRFSLDKLDKRYLSGVLNYTSLNFKELYVRHHYNCVTSTSQFDRDEIYHCDTKEIFIAKLPINYTQTDIKSLLEAKGYRMDDDKNQYFIKSVGENTVMDVHEIPMRADDFYTREDRISPNPTLPSYDHYNVQAQGVSGAMSPRVLENGALYGASDRKDRDGNTVNYVVNNNLASIPESMMFLKNVNFYFQNEISTYLETPRAIFDGSNVNGDIKKALKSKEYTAGISKNSKAEFVPRRKTSNYIAYYTNEEILKEADRLKAEGFLFPMASGFDRTNKPLSSIGAFKITAVDGKTYHYSLPVYNHEIIHRTHGNFKEYKKNTPRPENKAYFEKRELEPFATHWLLTAVTGADFVDTNGNGMADSSDYGYWVNFDYGKYSDAFIWSSSYGKPEHVSTINPNVKSRVRGRKQLYYLDRIQTRTHTALFVKSERLDGKSIPFTYGYAKDKKNYAYNAFTVPAQKQLKLDKILLVQGNPIINKASGNEPSSNVVINYPRFVSKKESAMYNIKNNILDSKDVLGSHKIVKTVDFNYDYSLVKKTPNSDANGRLSLQSVLFGGHQGAKVMPPYRFNYIDSNYEFNIEDQDAFGYVKKRNEFWSLNEIITPTGAKVKVDYEMHKVHSVREKIVRCKKVLASRGYSNLRDPNTYSRTQDIVCSVPKSAGDECNYYTRLSLNSNNTEAKKRFERIKVGDLFGVELKLNASWFQSDIHLIPGKDCQVFYQGLGRITEYDASNKHYILKFVNFPETSDFHKNLPCLSQRGGFLLTVKDIENEPGAAVSIGGIRTRRISVVDSENRYDSTIYTYGTPTEPYGYISYMPEESTLDKDIPFRSELPAPKVMYEFVTTTHTDSDQNSYGGATKYKFQVLKEKEIGKAKFGDFYEISKSTKASGVANLQFTHFNIKDNLSSIGQLLSVETFNEVGQKLSEIKNSYYQPSELPNKMGSLRESFQTYKRAWNPDKNRKELAISTTRDYYPTLLKHSTESKNGLVSTSEMRDFDPITGQAREVLSYNSQGVKILTKGIQAFRKYSKMGSKVVDKQNKNMLSQVAGSQVYIFKNNEWKPIGATVYTWNNEWYYTLNNKITKRNTDVWRVQKSYTWNGQVDSDGIYQNFDEFNWSPGAVQSSNWRQLHEVTRYNQYSNTLETKDINGHYMATKMGDNYSKVIATANANYDEMYYSGAEYESDGYFDGGIKATGVQKVSNAHTGNHVVSLKPGQKAFELTVPKRSTRSAIENRFKISVWVRKGQEQQPRVQLNNKLYSFDMSEKIIAGNWVLLTGYYLLPNNQDNTVAIVSSQNEVQLDDFRLHPATSKMLSYVYDQWDQVSFITGSNGLSTQYLYDAAGRLVETRQEMVATEQVNIPSGFIKVSTNSYNYKRQ